MRFFQLRPDAVEFGFESVMLLSDFGQPGPEVSRTYGSVLIPLTQATLNLVNASPKADDGNPPGAVFRFERVDLLEVLCQPGVVIHNQTTESLETPLCPTSSR